MGLVWGLWAWWKEHRYQDAMEGIESEILGGRYALACRNLENLLSWNPDSNGGITYLLGSCELARGRNQAADAAWARVLPGSAFSERAIRGRLRLLQESGQFAAAEQLINEAARDRRNDATALRVLLVPMFSDQGRIVEAERLIADRWEYLNARGEAALEPAIKLLREHIELTWKPTPVEKLRAALGLAARLAPDDDRVWLGQANLATRTGDHDKARRLLDACQQRRPDGIPVWRARLKWSIATNRLDVAKQAQTHLPAGELTPAELHQLGAWIALRQGDRETERGELALLLEADPADLAAIDRLAQLADEVGQPARAAELRTRKEELQRVQARYEQLYNRKQPSRDAKEMASLASRLGRTFEARGWLTLALWDEPERADLQDELGRSSPNEVFQARK